MGSREQQLEQVRAIRDAAHAIFRADVDIVRSSLKPAALADRAGGKAADLTKAAGETVQRHSGALMGGAAALAVGGALLWLARDPLGKALATLREKFGMAALAEPEDTDGEQEEETR